MTWMNWRLWSKPDVVDTGWSTAAMPLLQLGKLFLERCAQKYTVWLAIDSTLQRTENNTQIIWYAVPWQLKVKKNLVSQSVSWHEIFDATVCDRLTGKSVKPSRRYEVKYKQYVLEGISLLVFIFDTNVACKYIPEGNWKFQYCKVFLAYFFDILAMILFSYAHTGVELMPLFAQAFRFQTYIARSWFQ